MDNHPANKEITEAMRRKRPWDKWPGDGGYIELVNCCGAPVDKETGKSVSAEIKKEVEMTRYVIRFEFDGKYWAKAYRPSEQGLQYVMLAQGASFSDAEKILIDRLFIAQSAPADKEITII